MGNQSIVLYAAILAALHVSEEEMTVYDVQRSIARSFHPEMEDTDFEEKDMDLLSDAGVIAKAPYFDTTRKVMTSRYSCIEEDLFLAVYRLEKFLNEKSASQKEVWEQSSENAEAVPVIVDHSALDILALFFEQNVSLSIDELHSLRHSDYDKDTLENIVACLLRAECLSKVDREDGSLAYELSGEGINTVKVTLGRFLETARDVIF